LELEGSPSSGSQGLASPKTLYGLGTELDGPANAGGVERVTISLVEEPAGDVTGTVARGNFLQPQAPGGFG